MNKFLTKIAGVTLAIAILLGSVAPAQARMLSQGTSGNDVIALQTWLIGNGYTIPLIEAGVANPGYFGEQTKNAVMMYQEDTRMLENGIIDSDQVFNEPKQGSATGPDQLFPFINNNGIITDYWNLGAVPYASTTVQFRLAATSTIEFASCNFSQMASSTMVEIGYDTAGTHATSTSLAKIFLPTAGGSLQASTTAAVTRIALPTNTNIAVKVGEAGLAGSSPKVTGICKFLTRQVANAQ